MMPKWLFYSILSILIWGVWGAVPKATSNLISPQLMQVISTMGLVPIALLYTLSKGWTAGDRLPLGMGYAFLTGLCGSVGNLAMLAAMKRGGEASTVLPLTAIFPVVTVVLARVILREKLNVVQALGIGLALAALYGFNAEGSGPAPAHHLPFWKSAVSVWMAYSLLALLLYGIAGVTQKLATNHISSELSTVCFAAGFVPVAGVIVGTQPLDWTIPGKDWYLATLFGVLMGFAMLAQFTAYRHGKAAVVTAVTALYPAMTVALAVPLFHEGLDARKLIAIVLALTAALALSHEGQPLPAAVSAAGESVSPRDSAFGPRGREP